MEISYWRLLGPSQSEVDHALGVPGYCLWIRPTYPREYKGTVLYDFPQSTPRGVWTTEGIMHHDFDNDYRACKYQKEDESSWEYKVRSFFYL